MFGVWLFALHQAKNLNFVCVCVAEAALPKDREGEKSDVRRLWAAAINQSVSLFIEKTAAGTRIINIVSVLRVNREEINLFYSAPILFFSGRKTI